MSFLEITFLVNVVGHAVAWSFWLVEKASGSTFGQYFDYHFAFDAKFQFEKLGDFSRISREVRNEAEKLVKSSDVELIRPQINKRIREIDLWIDYLEGYISEKHFPQSKKKIIDSFKETRGYLRSFAPIRVGEFYQLIAATIAKNSGTRSKT